MNAHNRSRTATAILLCTSSVVLAGCGFTWPEWAIIESDPLAALTSGDRVEAPAVDPQNSPLSLQAAYDPLVNSEPLSLEPGAPLGSLGLNMDMYFDPGIRDQDMRIDRLERAIVALHRDFKSILPALQSMNGRALAVSSTVPSSTSSYTSQTLPVASVTTALAPSNSQPKMGEITSHSAPTAEAANAPTSLFTNQAAAKPETSADNNTVPDSISQAGLGPMPGMPPTKTQAVSPQPVTAHVSPKVVATNAEPVASNIPPAAPPVTGTQNAINKGPRSVTNRGSAVVSGIRVGQHPDKVRVVFDVTEKTNYRADLDNDENILVVEMPDAKWKTPATYESFGTLPIVKSYKVESFNGNAGNLFILQLKKNTKIMMQGKFPALSGSGERIVIDLEK